MDISLAMLEMTIHTLFLFLNLIFYMGYPMIAKKTHSCLKSIFLIIGFLMSWQVYAWNAVGHAVIATIAYERLKPDVRAKVDKMVSDLTKEYPTITQFNQMAPLMDDMRRQNIGIFAHLHYINHSFSTDGTVFKSQPDTHNVVWAIHEIEPIIKSTHANPYERARFLAFLVHLVGDVHQPLHNAELISAAHPEGDKGGNLYHIDSPTGHRKKISLHQLWDGGLGLFDLALSQDALTTLSHQITSLYPENYFQSKIDNLIPEEWSEEELKSAMSFVYTTKENEKPTPYYMDEGKKVAEQMAALSGYRLANLLNHLLSS